MSRLPRLPPAVAKAILVSRDGFGLTELSALQWPDTAHERFAATGGPKVTVADVAGLREELDRLARNAGYPERTLAARQIFDRTVAVMLAALPFGEGEMLRAEVWSWICVNVAPHIVQWRFGATDRPATWQRSAGSLVRNAFGRLWLRGRVFDRGPGDPDRWGLVCRISEDASVAILERTAMAADRRLARALGEVWLSARGEGPAADEKLRQAAIRVRIGSALLETAAFAPDELDHFIRSAFGPDERTLGGNLALKPESITWGNDNDGNGDVQGRADPR